MKALSSISVNFGLLNMPVKVYPMRNKEDTLSFSGLSNCCHFETGLKRYCKSCVKDLSWKTELKGYKISKNTYIELNKDELESIERLHNGIEILYFSKVADIPLPLLSNPYFLEPTANYKLYFLLNSVFAELSIIAVCRAVMKGYEHFAVLRHSKKGLELQFIEKITDLTIDLKKAEYSKDEEKQLKEIIKENIKNFDFSELKPIYINKVKELIQAKAEGREIKINPVETKELKEANLLNALNSMRKKKIKIEV